MDNKESVQDDSKQWERMTADRTSRVVVLICGLSKGPFKGPSYKTARAANPLLTCISKSWLMEAPYKSYPRVDDR